MDSCFNLVGARQHSVAKICNASQELTHINCKMTRSLYQVPYFGLFCIPKHALPYHVYQASRLVFRKAKNVAGQSQPKYLNIQTHGQYHTLKTQRIGSEKTYDPRISCRSYLGSVYRMRSLAVYSPWVKPVRNQNGNG